MNITTLTKKAWQIRRAAASKFGVKIMSISWKICLQMAGETQMTRKEEKLAEIAAQIEALRTMPEGTALSRTDDRTMTERRRARYVAEGTMALAAVAAMADAQFSDGFMKRDVLFEYAN